MELKEFVFNMKQKAKPAEDVHLVCKNCGQHDIRPRKDLYTGHVFDMEFTYTCTVCRGDMEILLNPNPKPTEEK